MNVQICMNSPAAIGQALSTIFKEKGWRQQEISELTQIHQSQICRILTGRFKRCSKNVLALCKYAEITLVPLKHDPRSNERLMEALSQAWDGTEAHAKIIARMLLTVSEFRRHS